MSLEGARLQRQKDPAGSRQEETLSGAEGTKRFRGPVRRVTRSPEPGGLAGERPLREPRTPQAGGSAGRESRRRELSSPAGARGASASHLREGT